MTDTSREAVERLRALAQKATPGPWRAVPRHVAEGEPEVRVSADWLLCCTASDDDAAYIAAVDPATVCSLLDERDALTHDITVALDSIRQEHEGRIAAEAERDEAIGDRQALAQAIVGKTGASAILSAKKVIARMQRAEAERDAARAAADLLREALTLCINALESGRFESTRTALQTANNTLAALAQEPPA